LLEHASGKGQEAFLQSLVAPASIALHQPVVLQRTGFTPRYCKQKPATRALVLGDAWHSLHPIGAQGLNLGLRDIRTLQELWNSSADPGARALIASFYRRREDDVLFTLGLTELLYFLNTSSFLTRFAQGAIIDALSSLAALRRHFFEHTVYGWSKV
jgi:2-octaprenyl-6-methoxyphenol hydroxylase